MYVLTIMIIRDLVHVEGGGDGVSSTFDVYKVVNTLMVRRWVVANVQLLPQKWPAPPWEVAGSFR